MSALNKFLRRLKRKRKLSPLPELPTELWTLILRYAADLSFIGPHGSLHAPVDFLSVSNPDLIRRLAAYSISLSRRAVLSVVCTLWHQITHPLLYEFVWVSSARQAKSLARSLSSSPEIGLAIRRLHIETPTLERCDPSNLRTIIEHCPRLAAYSDFRSIRRQPHSSPDHLLSSLARPGNELRRISWTNYDYDTRDHRRCRDFFLRLSPALGMAADDLDYLELSLCATDLVSPSFPSHIYPHPASIPVHLPSLRTLKLTLDNIAFSILSQWSLPALQRISVLSTDFSYTGHGFTQFFATHGPNIVQLELGHSTGVIEEHYLTPRPPHHPQSITNPNMNQNIHPHNLHHHSPSHSSTGGGLKLNLADLCPNLKQFICSADAEWNWRSPDWIAPHILLTAHPNVELIAIRDMSKRLLDDLDLYLNSRYSSPHFHSSYYSTSTTRKPFFRLAEQLKSLLRSAAFPKLRIIRDMSRESALMRSVKRMPVPGNMPYDVWDALPFSKSEDERVFGRALGAFWRGVKETCESRGVELQDWDARVIEV